MYIYSLCEQLENRNAIAANAVVLGLTWYDRPLHLVDASDVM